MAIYTKPNPAMTRAHRLVFSAVQRGQLVREPCALSDDTCKGRIEGHHDDYRYPLDVAWLCVRHHKAVHASIDLLAPALAACSDPASTPLPVS